jgi:hypothetical protein
MSRKADAQGKIDVEDPRLTAGERHQIRQILYRLQNGKTAQPTIYGKGSLEAAIDEVFGEVKRRH